ncbi:hypothetical protein [Mesorhizobium sp. SP-1A]|uniref:hypothetical protein n=1 Tax=Mesorhizobium sp. SP-1A TaxID=3077840 RepID=UPI0028F71DCE|nr:hypothetical protein [Mesorhizobium sp. SP-1A]
MFEGKLRYPEYGSLYPTSVIDKLAEQMGVEPFAALGDGLQGEVLALEDGRVMKVTESVFDAALSLYLQNNPCSVFPDVDAVDQVTVRGKKVYGIVRSDVESIFEGPEYDTQNDRKDCLNRYWYFLRHGPEQLLKKATEDLEGDVELLQRAEQLQTLLTDLNAFNEATGFDVSDINLPNIGVYKDRLVVRDFGMNSICPDILKSMSTNRLVAGPTFGTYESSFPTAFIDEVCAELGIEAQKSLGRGQQGEAILLNDGSVVKITPVEREAALALYLQEHYQAQFPKIYDVKRFEFEGKPHFAIHREQIDNFLPDNSSLIETIEMEADLARLWISLLSGGQSMRYILDFELEGKPDVQMHFNRLADFLEGIREFNAETRIDVEDYNFSNLGLVDDMIVLRDFGMNFINYALLNEDQVNFLKGMDAAPKLTM